MGWLNIAAIFQARISKYLEILSSIFDGFSNGISQASSNRVELNSRLPMETNQDPSDWACSREAALKSSGNWEAVPFHSACSVLSDLEPGDRSVTYDQISSCGKLIAM